MEGARIGGEGARNGGEPEMEKMVLDWATVHTKAFWQSNRQQESAACLPHTNLGGRTWHEYY
jgi:hypothetical protein